MKLIDTIMVELAFAHETDGLQSPANAAKRG